MTKITAHERSVRTRNQLWSVIDDHKLNPTLLQTYGTIDRIIKGWKLANKGNVKIKWAPEPSIEWPIVTEVESDTDEGQKYLVGLILEPVSGEKNVYEITSMGEECKFMGTAVPAHVCGDQLFQQKMKKLPIRCKHVIGSAMYVPMMLNQAIETEVSIDDKKVPNIKIRKKYEDIGEDLEAFYDNMVKHRMNAAQRLNILYNFMESKIKTYQPGSEFLKSIGIDK